MARSRQIAQQHKNHAIMLVAMWLISKLLCLYDIIINICWPPLLCILLLVLCSLGWHIALFDGIVYVLYDHTWLNVYAALPFGIGISLSTLNITRTGVPIWSELWISSLPWLSKPNVTGAGVPTWSELWISSLPWLIFTNNVNVSETQIITGCAIMEGGSSQFKSWKRVQSKYYNINYKTNDIKKQIILRSMYMYMLIFAWKKKQSYDFPCSIDIIFCWQLNIKYVKHWYLYT